ncbi:MAG: holo-ACP synthase [Oscillospiraceae bacterium]|nr:holo-ACP synthase [Oscillospiraceae bacterium]
MVTTGIDLIKIDRMKEAMKNPRFLTRVFSVAELSLFEERNYRAETVAANFAAKEAFSKALGTGVRGFSLNEVSVLRDTLGKPYFLLEGRAKQLAEQAGLFFSVSLTHTEDTAAAFVVGFSR